MINLIDEQSVRAVLAMDGIREETGNSDVEWRGCHEEKVGSFEGDVLA